MCFSCQVLMVRKSRTGLFLGLVAVVERVSAGGLFGFLG